MSLEIGSSFVNQPKEKYPSHLHIIISSPFLVDAQENVVLVNVTSWRNSAIQLNDPSCILNVGDHRFITGKSYIYYAKARYVSIKDLQSAIDTGLLIPDEICSDTLIEKILVGADNSKRIRNGIKDILKQQGLI